MRQMELLKKSPTQRALLTLAWIGVIVTAAFLRFDDLAERPMHADEATGARIMAKRMEEQGGEFNPKHYHGPLLADLTMPVCLVRGESTWVELTKGSLRFVTAVAGLLLVLVPLLWRRRFGDVSALAAATLIATSPLLVYFSRMFIHESLLVLCGAILLGLVLAFPRWGLPGLALGLMFAAKESFAISVLAWCAAIGLLLLQEFKSLSKQVIVDWLRKYGKGLIISAGLAAFTALICYTHGFTHLKGATDAMKTYFVYETVSGHDKPWSYYFKLLALPEKAAGVWWYGTPVLLLALYAYAMSWTSQVDRRQRHWIHFLAYSVVFHLIIYSIFAYKTPWLACFPWALTCWLAGLAFVNIGQRARWVQAVLVLFLAATLWSQAKQTRHACDRLHSDARNPYAYVPSRSSLETMETWLGKLRAMDGGDPLHSAAVVGRDYWPLPWYVRSFDQVGYWASAPEGLKRFPVVIVTFEQADAVEAQLKDTHAVFSYGLRDGVPIQMYLANDVWNQWIRSP